MKFVAWAVAAVSLYLGLGNLLNVVGLEHDSKYSDGATALFALFFLGIGFGVIYLSLKGSPKRALMLGVAPFVLIAAVMFVVLASSNWQ